jgi:DNA gyrase subunit A
MIKVKAINEVQFDDLDYYRTKNIPATGCFMKKDDRAVQENIFDLL